MILKHFGDPIWGLGTLILGQRGGGTPAPTPSGRDYESFCYFLSLFDGPGALLGPFFMKNVSKIIKKHIEK